MYGTERGDGVRQWIVCSVVVLGAMVTLWVPRQVVAAPEAIRAATAADRAAAQSIEQYVAARLQALQGRDPEKILSLLQPVVRDYPRIPALRLLLAEQYLRTQAWDRAVAETEAAQRIDADYVPAYLLHSRLLVLQNQVDKAVAELDGLRRRIPAHEEVYTTLARLHMQEQHYARAAQVMQEYLRRVPESLTAYYYLGTLFGAHLNQPARALAMFRRLVDLQPENIPARKALVQIYLSRDDVRGALRELLALEQHAAGDVSVQLRIAVLYYELKAYDKAITRIEDVLQRNPRASKLRYYLGVMYEEAGQFAQAKAAYERLPASSSYFKDAVMRIAAHYTRHEQTGLAIATLEGAMRRSRRTPEFYDYLSHLYQQQQNHAAAIRVLRRAARHFPEQPRFHYALAMQYERARDRRKAVRAMLQLLKHQPQHAAALNYVGYMYVEWGKKLDEAEAMLHTAIGVQPDDGHIIDSLGWLSYRRGDYAKALDLLERADALSPDEPTILRHIAQTLIALGRVTEARPLLARAARLAGQQSPPNDEELATIRRILDVLKGAPE